MHQIQGNSDNKITNINIALYKVCFMLYMSLQSMFMYVLHTLEFTKYVYVCYFLQSTQHY